MKWLHAGMVDALVCTQHKSHSTWVMTALDKLHASHKLLPAFGFAEHSRGLSRVSQRSFLCASFWQGVHFAVQTALGLGAVWSIAGNGLSVRWNCWRLGWSHCRWYANKDPAKRRPSLQNASPTVCASITDCETEGNTCPSVPCCKMVCTNA